MNPPTNIKTKKIVDSLTADGGYGGEIHSKGITTEKFDGYGRRMPTTEAFLAKKVVKSIKMLGTDVSASNV